jgi:hypothetical protein
VVWRGWGHPHSPPRAASALASLHSSPAIGEDAGTR